jgi:hypothetical protein
MIMRAPRVVGDDGKMLGCEMEEGCPWPATGIEVTEDGEIRFCELHAPHGVRVRVLEPGSG